ncbi:TniQ family protein [Deinococcus aquatilis]|uniref:TniQ family protein n=1 Tax=Deinococcus aquatilis TaxID=519440 RepID=UPI001FDF90A1|nr:TniQ family protein [Deinococcus aquatilis]
MVRSTCQWQTVPAGSVSACRPLNLSVTEPATPGSVYPYPSLPALQPDEWLGSWLFRLAHANGLPLHLVLADLGWTAEQLEGPDVPEAFLQVVARRADTPQSALAHAQRLPRRLLATTGRPGPLPYPFLGVPLVQVCPACWCEDAQPYLRLAWLDPQSVRCESHGTALRDQCPHCEGHISAAQSLRNKWTRKPRNSSTFEPIKPEAGLRRCYQCHGDLASAATEALPLPDVLPPIELHALPQPHGFRSPPKAHEWQSLISALEQYIVGYGLWNEIENGVWRISRTPQVDDSIWLNMTAGTRRARIHNRLDVRQATMRTLTWLLHRGPGTVQERLHVFGRLVLLVQAPALGPTAARAKLQAVWLAQALVDLVDGGLLRDWPRLLQALDARPLRRPPFVGSPFTMTDDQWAWVQPFVVPEASWQYRRSTVQGARMNLPLRQTFELLLDATQRSQGLNYAKLGGQHVGHTLGRTGYVLERDAQMGLALGALYRHAQEESWRLRKAISTGHGPAWLQQTHALFLSDGVIEVARRTNPGLYWDLLRRLMKG